MASPVKPNLFSLVNSPHKWPRKPLLYMVEFDTIGTKKAILFRALVRAEEDTSKFLFVGDWIEDGDEAEEQAREYCRTWKL